MKDYLREPQETPAIKEAMSKASKRQEQGLPVSNFASGNVGQMPMNMNFMKISGELNLDLPQEIQSLNRAILRGIKNAFEKPNGLSYTTTGGLDSQKELALKYFKRFHNISYDDIDRVVVTPGGQRALATALRSIKPGTDVFLSQWEYAPVMPILKDNGNNIIKISVKDNLRPNIDELKEKVTNNSVFYMSMPNNPSGYVSPKVLNSIADIMVDNGGGLIWDAPYIFTTLKLNEKRAIFDDDFLKKQLNKFNQILKKYPEDICLLSSISKTCLAAGLRFGFATGPEQWIDNMNSILGREELSSPTASFHIGQEVLREFLREPNTYKWLDKILADRLSLLIKKDLPLILPENGKFGALYVLMRTGEMDGKKFVEKVGDEYGIIPIPAQQFYGEPVNAIRLSLVSTPWSEGDKNWEKNVDNLNKAIEEVL